MYTKFTDLCVHRVYMYVYTYLHIGTPNPHVCVYMFTYMHTEFTCVCMYLRICRPSLHVYVCILHIYHGFYMCVCRCLYVYAHGVYMCMYVCTCMHAEFVCVCVYVYMFVHGVDMCVYLPQNANRPLSSCEGEENRSCLRWMVTECWLGLFNGLRYHQYAMGGGWGVDGNFTCGCADLHIRARSLHVCVCMFTCMDRGLPCVWVFVYVECLCTCMYTYNTCVCTHVYLYAHMEYMSVYACVHILYVCVYIFTYSHRVFMCDFQHVYIRLSSPRRGVIVSKYHKWPCHEQVFGHPRNSKDVRNSQPMKCTSCLTCWVLVIR